MTVAIIDGGYFVKRLQKHWLPERQGNMKYWQDRFDAMEIDIDELNENLYRLMDNDIRYLEIIMSKIGVFDKVIIMYDGIYGRRWRGEYYKNYKRNRSGIHALKHKGIDITKKIEKCLFDPFQLRPDWVSMMEEYKEADDLIAEYVESNKGEQITIFSTDGDMYQFLKYNFITLHNFSTIVTRQEVEEKIGLPIHKYVSWKTLVGDSSDNLPGMKGFGPYRAKIILKDYPHFNDIPEGHFLIHYLSNPTIKNLSPRLKDYRKQNKLSLKKVRKSYGVWWKKIEDIKGVSLNQFEYENLCDIVQCEVKSSLQDYNSILRSQYKVINLPFKK
tara:strand:- start:136 stop:1125 length:990 start_codon:yes stop_codon:yes gene_type:complete